MRDELRVGTTFDGFNMGSRKEGYYIGNWPWQGKSQDLKSVYHIVHTLWIFRCWSYDVLQHTQQA